MSRVPTHSTFKRILLEAFSAQIDLLLCNARRVWVSCYPYQSMPPLFEEVWRERQQDEAALRILKLAARACWPLDGHSDLEQAVLRILFDKPAAASDAGLYTWMQNHQQILLQLVKRLTYWHGEVNVEGYQAIATEAQRLGWPRHFKRDLDEIDFSRLLSPPAPRLFSWSIRPNGSRVYLPNNIHDVRFAQGAREHQFGGRHYTYDGTCLQHLKEEELLEGLIASLEPEHYRLCWTQARVLHMQTMSVPERLIDRPLTVQQAREMLRRAERDYDEVCLLKAVQRQQETPLLSVNHPPTRKGAMMPTEAPAQMRRRRRLREKRWLP